MLALCLASAPAAAEEEDEPTVGPDRPDVSDNTITIEPGLAQLELGFNYGRASADETGIATPVLVRVGVWNAAELRLSGDAFVRQTTPTGSASGLGDLGLGAKLRFWEEGDLYPSLGLEPGLKIPTASREKGLGSGSPDAGVALLTGKDLPLQLHTDVNLGLTYLADARNDGSGQVQAGASISTGLALLDGRINPFWEIYWFSPEAPGEGHVVSTDFGVIAVVANRVALDASADIGLTDAAGQFTVGGGMSFLFGSRPSDQ